MKKDLKLGNPIHHTEMFSFRNFLHDLSYENKSLCTITDSFLLPLISSFRDSFKISLLTSFWENLNGRSL